MRRVVPLGLVGLFVSLAFGSLGCDPAPPPFLRDSGIRDGSTGPQGDEDGDGIGDEDEGRANNRDTDGDGTPDYQDADSDGDGIPDAAEAGDDNIATPPLDSDGDSVPDFMDLDSDGNGIPDDEESDGDVDGDGIPNRADLDDDNDRVSDSTEIVATSRSADSDGDGMLDYQDPDSDNDTILDGDERDLDTDQDGAPDAVDLDSDDDGITDADEAGDTELSTPPVDSDSDGDPDFRDTDSDNDGLSDQDEVFNHGTDPTAADSDGDGVSDLIEIGAGTDPGDATDDPRSRGDFVFVVPYQEPPMPDRDTLNFETAIQFADLYFLFDRSGSMGAEINALQAAVGTLIGDLTCTDTGTACTADAECTAPNICNPFSNTCTQDPATTDCVPSLWSGAGWYLDDYNRAPDSNYRARNTQSLQSDPNVTSATGLSFDADCSGCGDEPLWWSVHAMADPSLATGTQLNGCTGPGPGRIGCPGFREEAVRILVAFTDENSNSPRHNVGMASAALLDAGITFIGVWTAPGTSGRADLVDLATGSESFRADGTTPLVYDGQNSDIVAPLTTAINEIVQGVPLRVTIDAADEPGDDGDALQFIERLETNTTGTGCTALATEDANPAGDGVQDTFPAVTPGLPVCWDVVPRQNETVMPAATPLVFQARLTVSGDGSPLDTRLVYFLVPPTVEPPGGPD